MQVPKDIGTWVEDGGDMAEVLMDLLDQTMKDFPVDPDRVYLSGVSAGGTVCWELAMRYPDRFAAIAPLASTGGGSDRKKLEAIKRVPIWAFHSSNDALTPIEPVHQTVGLLQELGGIVHLTEVDSAYHDCWTAAFEEHDLMGWLLAQNRGQPCTELPGREHIEWWYPAGTVGFAALLALAIVTEIRRRRSQTVPG
jgi:predicted peptidase